MNMDKDLIIVRIEEAREKMIEAVQNGDRDGIMFWGGFLAALL